MSDLIRPLGEYLSLLEQEGLLAGPVPDGLDRSAPVALVSCAGPWPCWPTCATATPLGG